MIDLIIDGIASAVHLLSYLATVVLGLVGIGALVYVICLGVSKL